MKFKKNIYAYLISSTILSTANNSFADEIYVICSNLKDDWKWLSNGEIKIEGKLKNKYFTNSFHFKYFILNGGKETYISLKNKCIDEFKTDLIYPQPVIKYSNKWIPFAENDEILFPGIITYSDYNFQLRVHYESFKIMFT